MTREKQIETIIRNCLDGMETLTATTKRLDEMRVRGGFDSLSFVGYDYQDQKWIELA